MEKKFETLLTIKEAAQALALKPSTLYDWVYKQKITYVMVGTRAVRIPRHAVEKLLADGLVTSQ